MDYKQLPLEERMQLASQYALLLTADNKSNEEIVDILKTDYALTAEQAIQAFSSMSSDYKAEYNSTVRSNFLKALGLIGFSVVGFLFYYFMGKEMGSLGFLAGIMAFLFGTSALGAVFLLGRIAWDKLNLSIIKKGPPGGTVSIGYDQFDKAMGTFVSFCFVFLATSIFLMPALLMRIISLLFTIALLPNRYGMKIQVEKPAAITMLLNSGGATLNSVFLITTISMQRTGISFQL